MTIIKTNSTSKEVKFINNGSTILVFALQDKEFWFTIGEYRTLTGAIKAAKREMHEMGYICNEEQIKALKAKKAA